MPSYDRVRETVTVTGVGAVTLPSAPPLGFRSFGSVVTNGSTFTLVIADTVTGDFEVSTATFTSGGAGTLTRGTKISSSNGGSAVNFAGNACDVFVGLAQNDPNLNLPGLTVSQVSGAAPLASPALTGAPTAPTAASGTNTTQLATTAFVQAAVGSGGGGGSGNQASTVVTGGTTATISTTPDHVTEVSGGSGATVLHLPSQTSVLAAGGEGHAYVIADNGTAGTGNITVSALDGALISGQASVVMNANYQCLTLRPNGTRWIRT